MQSIWTKTLWSYIFGFKWCLLHCSLLRKDLSRYTQRHSIQYFKQETKIMNYLFILSCLFAICLAVTYGASSTTRPASTTGRPATTTGHSALTCVCSCCSGLGCKPIFLQSFVDTTCTTKACKDKCKVFEPKHCDHTFLGSNDAYCTVRF